MKFKIFVTVSLMVATTFGAIEFTDYFNLNSYFSGSISDFGGYDGKFIRYIGIVIVVTLSSWMVASLLIIKWFLYKGHKDKT